MQTHKLAGSYMSFIKTSFSCILLACIAEYAEAACLNIGNTSIPESTPTANYLVHADGTLSAPATGLMWKRCLEGQTLNNGICEGTRAIYNWADALVAAEATNFAGYSDWRMPNPKELLSIFDDRCVRPALNLDLFPIVEEFGVWTATPTAIMRLDLYDEAWFFGSDGALRRFSELGSISILLVRDLP